MDEEDIGNNNQYIGVTVKTHKLFEMPLLDNFIFLHKKFARQTTNVDLHRDVYEWKRMALHFIVEHPANMVDNMYVSYDIICKMVI